MQTRMHVSASCIYAELAGDLARDPTHSLHQLAGRGRLRLLLSAGRHARHLRGAGAGAGGGGGGGGGAGGGGRAHGETSGRPEQIPLFRNGGDGGIVFSPGEANCLSCAWPADGGTMGKTCSDERGWAGLVAGAPKQGRPEGRMEREGGVRCVSGCVSQETAGGVSALDDRFWCSEAVASTAGEGTWCSGRPWRPTDLGTMLRRDDIDPKYNELILEPACWRANLPHSVEALFYPMSDDCAEGSRCRSKLRALHESLRSRYGPYAPPLLSMDLEDWDAPFAVDR